VNGQLMCDTCVPAIGAYVNMMMDADEGPDRMRAPYGANYDRLAQIKANAEYTDARSEPSHQRSIPGEAVRRMIRMVRIRGLPTTSTPAWRVACVCR
jgi:Berberine and berberine like